MILGLSGYARSGKDTLAGVLVEQYGFRRVAFADKLRELALAADPYVDDLAPDFDYEPGVSRLSVEVNAFGWDEAKKNPETRAFLQRLGVGARDILGQNIWITAALAGTYNRPEDRVVITDVRFQNEATAIEARGGHIIRIHRDGVQAVNDHVSEHDLDGWPFDATVCNCGTLDDLTEHASRLVGQFTA